MREENKGKKKKDGVEVVIDFNGLRDRLRRLSVPDSFERGLTFGPQKAELFFLASVSRNELDDERTRLEVVDRAAFADRLDELVRPEACARA